MRLIALLALLVLAACGHDEPLPVCSGPIFPINAGHWTPTAADLRTPAPIKPQ
jgi:hypothetical protein